MEEKKKTALEELGLNKIHYVCMGCRMESNEKIKCTTAGCVRHRNLLGECKCKNGKHTPIPRLDSAGFAIKRRAPRH
ncbi:hypothetical protein BH10PAT1_BH10PAT1_1060 [soil metagenome]